MKKMLQSVCLYTSYSYSAIALFRSKSNYQTTNAQMVGWQKCTEY